MYKFIDEREGDKAGIIPDYSFTFKQLNPLINYITESQRPIDNSHIEQ